MTHAGWSLPLIGCLTAPIILWTLVTINRLVQARNLRVVSNRGLLTMIIFLLGMALYTLVSSFGEFLNLNCAQYWLLYSASNTTVFASYLYRVWNLFALHRIANQAVTHALDTTHNVQLKQSLWFLIHRDYILSGKSAVVTVITVVLVGMIPTSAYFLTDPNSNRFSGSESETCDSALIPIMGFNMTMGFVFASGAAYLFTRLKYKENFGIKKELRLYAWDGLISISLYVVLKVIYLTVLEDDILGFFISMVLPLTLAKLLHDLNLCVFEGYGVRVPHKLSTNPNSRRTSTSTTDKLVSRSSPRTPNSVSSFGSPHAKRNSSPRNSFTRFIKSKQAGGMKSSAGRRRLGTSNSTLQKRKDIGFMLRDEQGFALLTKLAIAEFTVESVLFMKAVVELRYISPQLWEEECVRIQNLFILESSPLALNLSHKARNGAMDGVQGIHQGVEDHRVFEDAYNEIMTLFCSETWRRICKQKEFKEFAAAVVLDEMAIEKFSALKVEV